MAQVDIDLGLATETTLSLVKNKIPAQDADGGLLVHVTNQASSDVTDRPARQLGTVSIAGGVQSDALTASQLSAAGLATEATLAGVSAKLPALTGDGKLAVAVDTTLLAKDATLAAVRDRLPVTAGKLDVNVDVSALAKDSTVAKDASLSAISAKLPNALTTSGRLAVELPAGGSNTDILNNQSYTYTAASQSNVMDITGAATVRVYATSPSLGSVPSYTFEVSTDGASYFPAQWWNDMVSLANNSTTAMVSGNSNQGSLTSWGPGGSYQSRSIKLNVEGFSYLRITCANYVNLNPSRLQVTALRSPGTHLVTLSGIPYVNASFTSGSQTGIYAYATRYASRVGALAANTAVALSGYGTNNGIAGTALFFAQFNADIPLVVSVQHSPNGSTGWRDVEPPITMQGSAATGYATTMKYYSISPNMRPYVYANASAATYCEITTTLLTR